ncbi:farnesyl diphosphate synthase [Heterostelium album PN500]|uniref:Farnesyl diphosphate synthase n=1 Tax=Heterostelium pallidum (strain ATCC 26659 / Pp 5 / PN500) TaxID=670386 RepID=D3BCC1_HETP5|nr:farnesyl diphosphate synthase [Heterostelium album PN500]EFA80911.1 farnesyl diphosphate synthase [Heterostelium album PN500]|eukprot:XP_020433029.1 farnesyl diphosphate synthase [Heterostelium album PN500]
MLVIDDIVDRGLTRRGRTCWYLSSNTSSKDPNAKVGNMAIFDACMLENMIYVILKKYFSRESYYVDLIHLYSEVCLKTYLGQMLDVLTEPTVGSLDGFTIENYNKIVEYKTSYLVFYLPIMAPMTLVGKGGTLDQSTKDLIVSMGTYFQIRDDYEDCYLDPKYNGKIGRDVEDNKCSWLIVQAVKRANQEQLEILKNNYGKDEPYRVALVKELYNQLQLENVFKEYEIEFLSLTRPKIENSTTIPPSVLLSILQIE